jgi:ATP-dependent RNA helicase DeaD
VAVLDEADEMLDLGFREDLEEILDGAPAERRTLLFSATIAREIAALARRYQREAVRIDTVRRDEPHGDIEYRAVRVAPNEVEHAVVNILRYVDAPGALIFCATREAVRHLYGSLRERGFQVAALSGELSQHERSEALAALREGRARACVATDVAARGLDLPALDLVIHAELPQNKATLLHRSGRTGRAGRKGMSVLLVPYTRRRKAEQLLASAGIEATWSGPPMAEEVREKDQKRLLESPLLKDIPSEEDLELGRRLLDAATPEAVAAALARLWRAQLPEPEEVFDDRQPSEAGPTTPRNQRQTQAAANGGAWFRIAVGRADKADPKWLIPLICRRGHVTKADIGEIRILPRETRFEIAPGVEARFREALARGAAVEPVIGPAEPPHLAKPKRRGPAARNSRPRGR